MNLLANLKIGQKIYLVLAIVSLVAIGIGAVGLIGIKSTNRSLQTVYEDRVVCLKQQKVIADMYAVNIVDTCHKVRNGNLSWADGLKNIGIAEKEIHKQWTDYTSTYLVPEEEKLVKEAEYLMKNADASVAKAKVFMERQDKEALANYTITELYQNIDPISDKISELVNLQLEVAKQEYDKAQTRYSLLYSIFVAMLVGGIGIALFAAFYIIRMITQPLKAMLEDAKEVAGGNLAIQVVEIKSKDEVGQMGVAFNTMLVQLRGLVKQVSQSVEQVAASSEELTASSEQSAQAANQIAAAITDVANGAAEQLAASNETTAVVEQISAGIQQIAANTNQVAEQSAQAADRANDGGRSVDKAVNQMAQVENTVNTSAKVIAELGERSKEIGQIVDTIAGIAGQTNLLALNAAIEAARAGEQGRGFAVVAEEVRKLAEQSQEAAMQIADLIGGIQADTDKAVAAMNDGTREVRIGAEVVDAAGVAFREIVALVSQGASQVREISSAIQRVASGSQQIVELVKKIDILSKTSASEAQNISAAIEEQLASTEEFASSSQALAKMAEELTQAVSKFKV